MHSLRRAAARAACSSSITAAVPRQQVASFAMQVSKANARPASVMPLARHFSQTMRVAQDSEAADKQAVEEAIGSTEQTNSGPLSGQMEPKKTTEIFISNMTFDATDVHLQEAFGKYGEITDLKIIRDGRGLSRGFGFITFKDRESAERAVEEAHKSFWHGRRISVDFQKGQSKPSRFSADKKPAAPTNSLYIGNIPFETSDADLNRLFRELDNVTDVRVAVDRNTGWPRGFAHADFKDVESAQKAYEKLQSTQMGGRDLKVDFATAVQRGGRQNRDRDDKPEF